MSRSAPTASATNADIVPAEQRGAAGRVVQVHAQTRRGLVMMAAFVAAAVVAGVVSIGDGWWLPLHLFVVGALLTAISAVTQMLAVTWSAAPATRPAVAATQRWLLAAGTIALVGGRETGRTWLFIAGGVAVVVAMLCLAAILIRIRHDAVTARFAPAIEAYVAAVVTGAIGMTIGILLGAGRAGANAVELRDVHLTLNVFGLIGLVVAGTLPFFSATQVRTKMSPRATPTSMRTTSAVLAVATTVTAVGHLAARPSVVAVGLTAYALGLLAIGAMLPIYARRRLSWAGPRVVQLVAGLAWWVAMTAALAVTSIREANDRAVLQALVIGGLAQILVASLAYLGPVLRGGGHRRLSAGFAITRSWTSLVAGNTAALAALVGSGRALAVALTVWLADIALRVGRLVATARRGDDV
jgi:nitrite reductase (NO-forming)